MIGFLPLVVGFLLMLGLMFLGIPVAVAMFMAGFLGSVIYAGLPTLLDFGNLMWGTLDNFILVAIPLYILLGEILLRSGVTERMYTSLSYWLSPLPGGLLHTNIGASAMFAAVSGSSVATAATIGTVALPAFRARQYNERMVLGSIAGGSTLGILIPPSINLIIYGALTETSIGRLFLAGVVPGILMAGLFMLVIVIIALIKPSITGRKVELPPLRVRFAALVHLLPAVVIFVLVMGGIYFGWATPTESAALGVLFTLIVAFFYRQLSVKMLHQAFVSTIRSSAMMILIFVGASYLTFILGLLGVAQSMTDLFTRLEISPAQTIWAIVVFYVILGCFLETLSMLFATIPVLFPIILAVGIDPVWFGVFLVLMMEMALITPPVGINLYVVQGVRGYGPLLDVVIGILPFLAMILVTVALLIAFPEISTWLPDKMFKSLS